MFLLEKNLTDIQNNISFLIDINKYKLNREKLQQDKNKRRATNFKKTNEKKYYLSSILHWIKSFFLKKEKKQDTYDYLATTDYIQDYKEYLEHQEDKKDN